MAPFMVKILTCSGPSRELALVRSGGPACICTDNFGVVLRSGEEVCISQRHYIWGHIAVILDARWDLMTQWTKAHSTQAQKADMTTEHKADCAGD